MLFKRAASIALMAAIVLIGGTLPVGADVSLGQAATSTCSTIRLAVSNPSPGDVLQPGNYLIAGQAADTTSASPPGIDRVQAFFDSSRDTGGKLIGQIDTNATAPQSLGPSGFNLLVNIPNTTSVSNTHELFVYARSHVSGVEQVETVTFQLNRTVPTDPWTPIPTPPPNMLSLPPCGTPTPTPTFPAFPGVASTPGIAASVTPGVVPLTSPTLRVDNPQPGDTISAGMHVFEGLAFDSLAQSATGVDRVEIFLDPREQGGQLIGDATLGGANATHSPFSYELTAPIPNRKGGHMLTVYAHSSVTNLETSVSIPITVD
jgi:hypothetical protein